MQNDRPIFPEGNALAEDAPCPEESAEFIRSLTPLTAPGEQALHPQAVLLRADRNADPQAILRAFEHSLTEGSARESRGSHPAHEHAHTQESLALVVGTSGSTGAPKRTALSVRALITSARATEKYFTDNTALDSGNLAPQQTAPRPSTQWLLALPAHYVAGAQVLARSVLAGTTPVIAESISHNLRFTPEIFLAAAERLTGARRFISLVPTQLHKLLEAADSDPALGTEIYDALASFTGILLGGAPASASLLDSARQLGLKVVTTYGSAETAGGCVYSGTALPGVRVRLTAETVPGVSSSGAPSEPGSGRIWLGGEHLASGYLEDAARTASHFFTDRAGCRWYRTDDLGALTLSSPAATGAQALPRLKVAGRSDDVIITGGVKVSARVIAAVLEAHPAVREAIVLGIPDARWGTAVAAAVTLRGASSAQDSKAVTADILRELCAQRLGAAGAPKILRVLPEFPHTSTGKPDRRAIYSMLYRDHTRRRG